MIRNICTAWYVRITTVSLLVLMAVLPGAALLPETAYAQDLGKAGQDSSIASGVGQASGCATLALSDKLAGITSKITSKITGKISSAVSDKVNGVASKIPGIGAAAEQPVIDRSVKNVGDSILAAQTAASARASTRDITRCMLDSLAWTVAKMSIQSITRSTVNWINSGFNGSPAFVTDLQQNLSYLSDTVANNFFQQLNQSTIQVTGFNLTSPFQDQITQQLRQNYYKATGSLLGLNQYDLSGHSKDPRAFINGDFSQGGFNAFFSASQNPANNPFGAYMAASNALTSQLTAAAEQRKNEYLAGRGISSWRGNCHSGVSQKNADGALSLAKVDMTVGCPIRTPGSVIESQLENTLGSGIRQLELADSINEIVGALMGQLVNQVLGSGGLSGASQPSSGGGASYLSQATSPSTYSSVTADVSNGFAQSVTNDLTNISDYRDNWQTILDAANAAQAACGQRSDITAVITQATAGVNKGNTALSKAASIGKSIQDFSSNAADAGTKMTVALTQYESFLGSSAVPSSDEVVYSDDQSTDTSGTSGSPSLYTQMVSAKNSCMAHT